MVPKGTKSQIRTFRDKKRKSIIGAHKGHRCPVRNMRAGHNPMRLRIGEKEPHRPCVALRVTRGENERPTVRDAQYRAPRKGRVQGPVQDLCFRTKRPKSSYRLVVDINGELTIREHDARTHRASDFRKNLRFFGAQQACCPELAYIVWSITDNGVSFRYLRKVIHVLRIWFCGRSERAYFVLRRIARSFPLPGKGKEFTELKVPL